VGPTSEPFTSTYPVPRALDAAGIAAIAVLAMIVPARRALAIDPARTLREQ